MMAEPEAPSTTAERARLDRKLLVRLLPLLFVGYVVAQLDRNNVAIAKLRFLPDLNFTERMFGLGASLFYAGYVLCEIPSNMLVTRIGVRRTLVRVMFLWFVFCLTIAFMAKAWHYYLLRALLGGAEAGYLPGVLLYLSRWVPAARRARFTAIFMAAIPVSGFIGSPLSAAIMRGLDGIMGLAGWRWLFIVEALPALALALLFRHALAETVGEASWLTPRERAIIGHDLAAEQRAELPAPPPGRSALATLANPALYLLGVQSFALLAGLNGLNLWGPTILKEAGATDILRIGLLAALPQLVGVAALLGAAEASDRWRERRWLTAAPSLLAAAGWLLLPAAHGHPVATLALLGVVSAGVFGATGPFWSLVPQSLAAREAPIGIALVSTMGGLGAMTGPFVVGWLADRTGGIGGGLFFYAVSAFIGVIALLIATRTRRSHLL